MATKMTQTPYERALARANAEGIRVVADFGSHWRVRGKDGVTLYLVTQTDEGLTCACRSTCYCKHAAKVQERLNAQQAEREAAVAEAIAEVYAREQAERSAAIAAWNTAAVAETEAALAAGKRILADAEQVAERRWEATSIGRKAEKAPMWWLDDDPGEFSIYKSGGR